MRMLFLGDIVGKSGRDAVLRELPHLRRTLGIDFAIVNAENAAHGFGLTAAIANDVFDVGADVITTGNHVWDQRELLTRYRARTAHPAPGEPAAGRRDAGPGCSRRATAARSSSSSMSSAASSWSRWTAPSAPPRRNSTPVRWARWPTRSSSMSTPRRPRRRWRWGTGATDVPRPWSARIRTSRPPTRRSCPRVRRSILMPCWRRLQGSVIGFEPTIPLAKFVQKLPAGKMQPAESPATVWPLLFSRP